MKAIMASSGGRAPPSRNKRAPSFGSRSPPPARTPRSRPACRTHFRSVSPVQHGERRKRYLHVAIDRRSRSVHLAVKDDETERSAIAFLREAAAAFPFRLTHVLTDNGSRFTPAFAEVCVELGAEYRHTRPYSPHTNGMVERFNGRVGGEVLGITVSSHTRLERLLRGFNAAYNGRPIRGGKASLN